MLLLLLALKLTSAWTGHWSLLPLLGALSLNQALHQPVLLPRRRALSLQLTWALCHSCQWQPVRTQALQQSPLLHLVLALNLTLLLALTWATCAALMQLSLLLRVPGTVPLLQLQADTPPAGGSHPLRSWCHCSPWYCCTLAWLQALSLCAGSCWH
jgi:hypothetical protein